MHYFGKAGFHRIPPSIHLRIRSSAFSFGVPYFSLDRLLMASRLPCRAPVGGSVRPKNALPLVPRSRSRAAISWFPRPVRWLGT